MSLITRCPACGTMFKVVPDQLRISEGWVRCGHCSEVFDASSHMQQPGSPAAIQAQAPMPVPAQAPVEPPIEPFDPFEEAPQPARQGVPGFAHDAGPGSEYSLDDVPQSPPAVETPVEAAHRPSDFIEIEPLQPGRDETEAGPELHNVSFVRDAQRKAFWRRPAVRAGLVAVSLLLAAALGLQVAVQERNRLAAIEPSLKPLLVALCEPLACTVGPLRQIEAIVIDASAFSKLRGDAYRLNFTLKNQAPVEVAMPAIELTLTDTLDQPLLRRVLSPTDMGAKSPVIEASSEWTGTFALAVAGNGGARIAGYRVLAFYP